MTDVRRISHCSHWGSYTILVEDGKIIGIEPSEHDPNPSPIIQSAREWAKTDRRILTPMVRKGWLERSNTDARHLRGEDQFLGVEGSSVL